MTHEEQDLMITAEVAAFFKVDPKTVTRWDTEGGLRPFLRTPGGHRRYLRSDVEAYIAKPAVTDGDG